MPNKPLTYTLRRAGGNRTVWAADTGGGLVPQCDTNLGRLVEHLWTRAQANGSAVAFVLEIADESEAAALADRRKADRERLAAEIKAAESTMRYARRVLKGIPA